MKNELIDLKDYVLNHNPTKEQIIRFAKFLDLTLNISFFAPAILVNGKWEVLEEPCPSNYSGILSKSKNKYFWDDNGQYDFECYQSDLEQFQQAKDKVIFEGFEVSINSKGVERFYNDDMDIVINDKTIQDLIKYKPTLTPRGIKDSGIN